MTPDPETARLEHEMIDAITAYLRLSDPAVTRLRAVRIMAVTDNGDTPSAERVLYANGESSAAMIIAAAPVTVIGAADPPSVPGYGAIPFRG